MSDKGGKVNLLSGIVKGCAKDKIFSTPGGPSGRAPSDQPKNLGFKSC